jgi:hypothetical protein
MQPLTLHLAVWLGRIVELRHTIFAHASGFHLAMRLCTVLQYASTGVCTARQMNKVL